MRFIVCYLILLFSASVHAQGAPAEPQPIPTAGQRALLVGGAMAGGLVALPLGPFAPVGVPVATYATSAALGLDPTIGGVLLDATIGAAAGTVVWAGTLYYITEIEGRPRDLSADIGALLAGLVTGAVVTGGAHGVRLSLLRQPDGAALGLAVTIRP